MYQTLEAEPSESAKPVTFDSFQVAFAPGAPGAVAARAGAALATMPAASSAATPSKLAPRRFLVRMASSLAPLPRPMRLSGKEPGIARCPVLRRDNGFPHNIGLAETVGQNLALK